MNLILMCGGMGTRAKPYRKNLPKEMLPYKRFSKKPVIMEIIDSIAGYVNDIIVCCGEDKKTMYEQIAAKFKTSERDVIWSKDSNSGIFYALRSACKLSNDDNIICFCDSWTDSINWFAKFCATTKPNGLLMLTENIEEKYRINYGCIVGKKYIDKSNETDLVPNRSFGVFYLNKNLKFGKNFNDLHDMYNELLHKDMMGFVIGKSKHCYDVGNKHVWKKNIVCKKI